MATDNLQTNKERGFLAMNFFKGLLILLFTLSLHAGEYTTEIDVIGTCSDGTQVECPLYHDYYRNDLKAIEGNDKACDDIKHKIAKTTKGFGCYCIVETGEGRLYREGVIGYVWKLNTFDGRGTNVDSCWNLNDEYFRMNYRKIETPRGYGKVKKTSMFDGCQNIIWRR